MHLLMLASLAVGADLMPDEAQTEVRLPAQSKWVLEKGCLDGNWFNNGGELHLLQEDGGVLIVGGVCFWVMRFHLDPQARHPSIDLQLTDLTIIRKYVTNERQARGLYRFDGDRLVLCVALPPPPPKDFPFVLPPDRSRPTEFAARPGDGCVLLIFRRTE